MLPFFREIQKDGFTVLFAKKQTLALQSTSKANYLKDVFNSRQRRDHRRLIKKMEQDYQVQIEMIAGEGLVNMFDLYWQRFLSIYQNSWKHHSHRSLSTRSAETGFFYSLFKHYAAQHLAYLSFLHLDNTDVAAVWKVRYQDIWYGLQIVYDEAYKQYSPGIFLIQETILNLLQNGPVRIDFMGSQKYKQKFSNLENAYYDFYILANRPYSRILKKLSVKSKIDFQTI